MNLEEISTIELADKVLPFFNDHDMTNLHRPFIDFGMTEEEVTLNQRLVYDTLNVLQNLEYIIPQGNSNNWKLLTETGRKVKYAGGHFAYLKKIEEKAIADTERQKLNDEKLKYDVKNVKRIFKTYWWTFWFSVIALAISLGLGVLKLLEVFQQTPAK